MSDTNPSRPRSGAMWLGVALVLSLAVNTFFVGIMVGSRATSERWADGIRDRLGIEHSMDRRGMRGMPAELDPRRIGRMLPESARDGARQILEASEQEIRNTFERARQARLEAFDAMRAEPFVRAELEVALAASRASDQLAAELVHRVTTDIIAGLTAEERATLEQDMMRRHPGRHDRRDHYRDRREERRNRHP